MQQFLHRTQQGLIKLQRFRCIPTISPLYFHQQRWHWKLGSSSVQVGEVKSEVENVEAEEEIVSFQSARYAPEQNLPVVYHNFKQLGLREDLLEALEENGLHKPTEIQMLAIPRILEGEDVLVASHTGSGKTLAYLLPIVQRLKEEEDEGIVPRAKRPRALILGPTRELTDQILYVSKRLCHFARFRSVGLNAGKERFKQRKFLEAPVDMVVATPTRFLQHLRNHNVLIGDIRYLVLDEADTLFDEGFGPEVFRILELLRKKNETQRRPEQITTLQCMLVGASVPHKLQILIDEHFPGLEPIKTKTLHKGVSGAKHVFQALGPGEDKLEMLLQTIEPIRRTGQRMMVFCNTTNCCRAVEHFLHERGMRTVCFHGEVPLKTRQEQMKLFVGEKEEKKAGGDEVKDDFEGDLSVEQGQNVYPVMVCTDLAARGLDISGNVQHVINFDFPKNPIDYIHRTGRTARAGKGGTVTSLVLKQDRILADKIEWALGHGEPLDSLTGRVTLFPTKTKPKKTKEVKERKNITWHALSYSSRIKLRRKFQRQRNWSLFQKDKALTLKDAKLFRSREFKSRDKSLKKARKVSSKR
eukprot:TRINITY_DN1107_c0_g2_i10.p2 TRINITY_DN1107_c0_g2~~TRINITY_DN1107_c0_g2_i10.p2  ORF type:complete len:584 (-),score=76.32 TRINITY_DN1107_c0_g2_i10:884-2635(-)